MLPYRDSRFTKIILIVFFMFVLAYAYFEGRALLFGPKISIEGRAMEVSEPLISIEGRAERIASLSMNGKTIPVTEAGDFSEEYVLTPGYNRIILEARDRYGKATERLIEIIYTPEGVNGSAAPASDSHATSTEAMAPEE